LGKRFIPIPGWSSNAPAARETASKMSKKDVKPPASAESGVLVIGGGISGIVAALELARLGIPVTIIEKEASLGGLAASFCCKASEACNKCFACVVDKRIREVTERNDIFILTQTELKELTGVPGAYRATVNNAGKIFSLNVSALVVAVGIDPFDAAIKGEYGYGVLKNVVTARDLEEMLRLRGGVLRPSDGSLPLKIAFFQCVGSRDQAAGNLYCSQACCAYALRLIRAIRHKYPEINMAFLYMDIQPAGVDFSAFLSDCRQDVNIRFVRSIPSKVYHVPKTDSLRVRLADPDQGEVREEIFDMVVLSVGMVLKRGARSLAEQLEIGFDEDGFLAEPRIARGVFVTGACTGPKDIDCSITQAKSSAVQVYQFLLGRS